MPTLRSASLCAFFAIILFSCNSKKNDRIVEQRSSTNAGTEQSLPNETVDITSLQKNFLDASTQHFSVSSTRVSELKSKKGLKITVDPAALENENGAPFEGNIDVSVIELTNVDDLFKSNAATVSDGRLLISGGSYFIGMENSGKKIRIKKGQTLQAELPMLKKDGMELFYGQRNDNNDMNWKRTNVSFRKYESLSFTGQNNWDNPPVEELGAIIDPRVFKSLNETVYYYGAKTTLGNLVDTLNKNSTKVYLQKISYWPKNLPTDRPLDTNYLVHLYGPKDQYILRAYKAEQKQREDSIKRKAAYLAALAKWQPHSLSGQIQKYYAPTALTSLGWINCDRFYEQGEQTETELELPYTFNNSRIEYFIVFKSFNGLLNDRADFDKDQKAIIKKLPVGEEITFVAFTKKNGKIYQAKENYVIGKNKTLPVNFKEISATDMNKLFGANVKI